MLLRLWARLPIFQRGMEMLKKLVRYLPEKMRQKLIRSQIRLGDGAPSKIIFKLAETKDELEQAFKVLHDAYVDQGYMSPHPSGMRVTKYHALPTTAVLIAKEIDTGIVVGTVSIVRDTSLGLPLDSAFPLSTIKKQYHHLAEVSSLAILKKYRTNPAELLWPLLRYFYLYLKNTMKIDAYVIGVNPLWHDFYTGILGFTQLKGFEAANYSFANNAPVVAYFVDTAEQEKILYKFFYHHNSESNFYRYCIHTPLAKAQYIFPIQKYYSVQNTIMNQELFQYFFIEKTDALGLMSEEDKEALHAYYPKKDFSALILGKQPAGSLSRASRFITRFKAQVSEHEDFKNFLDVSVLDFSATGLRITSEHDLPSVLQMRIGIGDFASSHLKAEVKRRVDNSYGLEITSWDKAWTDLLCEMNLPFQTSSDDLVWLDSKRIRAS